MRNKQTNNYRSPSAKLFFFFLAAWVLFSKLINPVNAAPYLSDDTSNDHIDLMLPLPHFIYDSTYNNEESETYKTVVDFLEETNLKPTACTLFVAKSTRDLKLTEYLLDSKNKFDIDNRRCRQWAL